MSDEKDHSPRALTASGGIAADALIPALIERPVRRGFRGAREGDVVVGWGLKENTEAARAYARKQGLEYWRLEDGFLGYLGHPSLDDRRLSLVIDKSGIYYDAHTPSDLEKLLNEDHWITPELLSRASSAMARIRKWGLSKYNHAPSKLSPEVTKRLTAFKGPKVLVVDQTFGDKSIEHGMASDDMFADMLKTALEENPTALVIVKIHPDVLAGTKRGHFDVEREDKRVLFMAEDVTPQALMREVDHVYVVTSQMGLEGLIAGKKVTCFGLPFYAGWGLTHDRQLCEARIANRTLEELFAAAFLLYSRYINPFTGERAELEHILDLLIAERQMERPRGKRALAVGFSLWKRGFIPEFIGLGPKNTMFITPCSLADWDYEDGDIVVLWGRKHDEEAKAIPPHVPVWRMEDGFLRSVGLGSDLRRPSSLVLDRRGIYYDGGEASDLEYFLKHHEFDSHDLKRGAALRGAVLSARVSKYNVGAMGSLEFKARADGKPVILVPGQVEADASLAYGSPLVSTNADLIQAVRAAHPDAYLVFKPHPDVASGNRLGAVDEDILESCVDETIVDADIIDCLDAVDEVHTMTSLTGFEALLRGVPVTTYGMPFYAGWGLSNDRMVDQLSERRGESLSIDALVYGLLCVYARYIRWPGGQSYSPEALVADIAASARGESVVASGPLAPLQRFGRKVVYLAEAIRR